MRAQTPMASSVAGIATHESCSGPMSGRLRLQERVDQTCSRFGQKKAAYCERPMAPEAIESGALNDSCQINKKETRRPSFWGP